MFYKKHNKNEKERFWQLVKNSAQRRIVAHKLKKRVQSKYSFIQLFCIYKLLKIYHLIPLYQGLVKNLKKKFGRVF